MRKFSATDELKQLKRKWLNLKMVYKLEKVTEKFGKMRYVTNELNKYNGYNLELEKLYKLVKFGLENAQLAEKRLEKIQRELKRFIRRI